jgi:hypothetical protein
MPSSMTLNARFEIGEDREFRHVPFEVPDGVRQVHIEISYNDQIGSNPMLSGGNTLDIGVFDQRGIEAGGPGLRGWSGSEKTAITIDTTWATPPYRAGEVQPGTWHLLLSAYKIGPNGLDIEARIEFDNGHTPPETPPVRNLADIQRAILPHPAEPNWYRGDLHQHTIYSDGDSYPHEVAAIAYQTGLDFYGITDHNRAQSPVDLVPHGEGWPVLVPGVEVTTYAGHFNVWGTHSWYDFRDSTQAGIQAAVDAARADGGFLSLNHPRPFGPAWDYPDVSGFDAIETWNGWWGRLNNLTTAYWADALNYDSPDRWHVGIAGSDVHKNREPGNVMNPLSSTVMGYPTLWIQTDEPLSDRAILEALRAGRCFISESPAGPQLYARRADHDIVARVVGAEGDALMAVGPHGCIAATAITSRDETFRWPVSALRDHGDYVRFELHTPTSGIRALSNPIWFDSAS